MSLGNFLVNAIRFARTAKEENSTDEPPESGREITTPDPREERNDYIGDP